MNIEKHWIEEGLDWNRKEDRHKDEAHLEVGLEHGCLISCLGNSRPKGRVREDYWQWRGSTFINEPITRHFIM